MPYLPDPTASVMPMGRSVLPLPPDPASFRGTGRMPLPMPGADTMASATEMTASATMPPDAQQAPSQPQGAPWQTRQQPDGSSIYFLPGMKGDGSDDIVIGVNQPPKLPKAMQAPTQQSA